MDQKDSIKSNDSIKLDDNSAVKREFSLYEEKNSIKLNDSVKLDGSSEVINTSNPDS